MFWLKKLLPASIVARVFALYSFSWLLCVAAGTVMFYTSEFADRVEGVQAAALMQVELSAQTVSESAVIGDYDTIKRTLDRVIAHPLFERAAFIDLKGGRIDDVISRIIDTLLAFPGLLLAIALVAVLGPILVNVLVALTIIGWVAMWKPLEIYLYRWWPLLALRRLYRRLARMPVELRCADDSR